MKSLVPSLGDLFQQPVDNGSFAPGLPSQHLSKSPSLASIQTPNADQRRDAYQQRKSPVEPTPSPMQHDGVGDGNHPGAGNRFESPSPLNLFPAPTPPPAQPAVPEASPAEPTPPEIASADAEPANTGKVGVYDNGMYWKLLDRDSSGLITIVLVICLLFM